jgi:glycosyltransferase involved in cell wall biosynthesis
MSDLRSTDIGGALQKIDYDILHLHWVNLRFLPLDQLPKDKPIVWTLHDSWPFCGICHYFFDCDGYQAGCGHCPQLGSASNRDLSNQVWRRKKSALLGKYPVTIIPNCLDTGLFRPVPDVKSLSKWPFLAEKKADTSYVLYGAMNAAKDERKGFKYLLSALELLAESEKSSLELVVFGADKPMEGMPASIPAHYVGYVTDAEVLVSLYNLADVMVVPSLNENLSCVIMESLSCGTPVVAFDIGGNGDMIDHQVNGYLAREKDSEDLSNGMLWCLEHNGDRLLSRNARQKVLDQYAPDVVGIKYSDLYYSLTESNSNELI